MGRNAGAARWAYNWGLAEKRAAYERGDKTPSCIDLDKRITQMKRTSEFAWLYEVSRYSYGDALRNLDKAYKRFFNKTAKKPVFKRRRHGYGSFTLYGCIHIFRRHIQLPNIGRVRLKQAGYIPDDSKPKSATVSEAGGRWYVSVLFDVQEPEKRPTLNPHVLGVDLGIRMMATISNGCEVALPKEITESRRKIERLGRNLSRKQKGSERWKIARDKVNRAHRRLANLRRHTLHTLTSRLARNSSVVIEDLNVRGMMSGNIARSIGEVGMYEFRRQLEYKLAWNCGELIVADRWYPSSKTCSQCGSIHGNLERGASVFVCPECGFWIGRDLNAARNLKALAGKAPDSLNARGDCGRPSGTDGPVRQRSMKREGGRQSNARSPLALGLARGSP